MPSNLQHAAGRLIQRQRHRHTGSLLRARIEALRLRLARQRLAGPLGRRRRPGRITPMERVMLRSAVHNHRSFPAQVNLQALLSAGIARHTHRVETTLLRVRDLPLPAMRQLDRMLVTQRVLRELAVQRLTMVAVPAAPPRTAMVTRLEPRNVFPIVQLTLVRAQPAAPVATRAGNDVPALAAPATRAVATQPQGAAAAAPLPLPPQELSRLTDHVIRQLDRRVLSYQERTGRV